MGHTLLEIFHGVYYKCFDIDLARILRDEIEIKFDLFRVEFK